MFAIMANLPGMSFGNMEGLAGPDFDKTRASVAEELLKMQAQVVKVENELSKERAAATPDRGDVVDLERDLADARRNLASLRNAQTFLSAPDGEAKATSAPENWLEAKYRHAKESPKLLIYKLKTSAYKYSWALIPISLPFIWLLFPFRRDVGLYDHAIFATYSLSFMSLLVAVLGAVGVGSGLLFLAATIIPPLHIYKQLKGTYRLSRLGGLRRTAWMLFFTLFTSTAFTLLLLTMGVAD